MPFFRAYAETRIGGGPLRRFLLDTDIGPVGGAAPTVINYLDLDGVAPEPDLQVRVIIHSFRKAGFTADNTRALSETRLEIRLVPMEGRVLTNVEIRVFVNTSDNVFPLAGPPTPNPSNFIFIGYRGAPGQNMPTSLSAWLNQSKVRSGANVADPFTDDDIDIVVTSTPVVGPLHLEGGLLEGTVSLQQAVETSFVNGVYDEKPAVDIRALALTAPSATIAKLSVSTPGVSPFPLECLWVGIATDHTIDAPMPAPLVALAGAGAGNVDRGAHRYKVAYGLQNGKETKAGPPSLAVTVADPAADGRVRLTAIPLGPPPPAPPEEADLGVTVVARRIYRTVASATGDDGEFFRAGEIPDNVTTQWVDNGADGALAATAPDRMVVHYSSKLRHDVDGSLLLRDAGVEDRYDPVELRNTPTDARVLYTTRPDPGRPRVRWQADAVMGSARLVLPTLRSGALQWGEARAVGVPQFLGAHWSTRGSTRTIIEISGSLLGTQASTPIGKVEALLAAMQRPWRDAPQAVCVEYVARELADGRVIDARTRVAARGLRRARVAFGEAGPLHARDDDGVKIDLSLAPDQPPRRPRTWRPGRALRALILTDTSEAGQRAHQHLAVRAGELPNDLSVDLRLSPDTAPGGAYFGMHVIGVLERLKVLALTDPTAQAAAYAADGARLWLALPRTPKEVDAVRAGTDALLALPEPLFAELSVRDPRGLDSGGDPLRHLKAAVATPGGSVHAGPAAVAFGTSTGSTADTLNDPAAAFDAALVGRSIRYLTGTNAGARRSINAVASATSLTTDAFAAVPGDGDRYAIEALVFGTAAGSTADTLNDPNAAFDAALVGRSVRYLTGVNAGAERPITAVANTTSLTTDAFAAAPANGDPYVIDALGGIEVDTALEGAGLTARVAASKDLDSFLAVRATPQIRLRNAPVGTAPAPVLRAATGRVYGVRAAGLATGAAGALAVPVLLDPNRVNKALRAYVRELDTRFAPAERDLLKARVETLPPEVGVRADLSIPMFGVRLSARSGPGAFWMEPAQMRAGDAGPRAGSAAGIGLVEFQIDGIPRALRFTVLGADQFPPNFPGPDANWHGGGITAEVSEMASIDFLRMISWGRDHRDDLNKIFWGRIDATFVRWNQDAPAVAPAPPVLVPVSLWMPGEIDPDDEDEPESGLGYRIPTPGVTVTLDIDVYEKETNQANVRWVDLPGAWDLRNELQMKNYAGEVTVASPLGASPAGDEDAGPGEWFLRIIDGRPWYIGFGSAYFGNTGGWIASRPRIFV